MHKHKHKHAYAPAPAPAPSAWSTMDESSMEEAEDVQDLGR